MTCEFLLQKSQYSDPARWIRGMMWMFLFLVQISLFPHEKLCFLVWLIRAKDMFFSCPQVFGHETTIVKTNPRAMNM